MSDYGLKISLPGYDVKTCTPEQCALHSSYDSLKIKPDLDNPQEGNLLVNFANNYNTAQTIQLLQVKHGYGYRPAVYFFNDIVNSSGMLGAEVGTLFTIDQLSIQYFEAVIDEEFMTFNFVSTGNGGNETAGKHWAFRYAIFANDGQ